MYAKAEYLKLINWELASSESAAPSPADASAAKVFGTELATEAYRLLMEILGPSATLRQDSPGALLRGRVERMHRAALILTFGGGTNEVQRDIIGTVALRDFPGRTLKGNPAWTSPETKRHRTSHSWSVTSSAPCAHRSITVSSTPSTSASTKASGTR